MAKGRKSKKKEEVFHVAAKEVLTAARVALEPGEQHIGWDYLVKWANYPDSENSWEPESNLAKGCERLLKSFWDHVGFDNKDYPLGHVVRPKKSWIEKEKAFFQSEFDKVLKAEKDKERARSKEKGKGKETEEEEYESEEDEKAKEKTTKNPKKRRRKASREVSESSTRNSRERMSSKGKSPLEISSDDDDDDVPLHISLQNLKQKAAKHQVAVSSDEEPLQSSSHNARPTKIQKINISTFKAKEVTRRASPSPSSLFSDHSSPEVVVSAKVQQKGPSAPSVPSVKPTRRPTNPQAKIASMPISEIPMNSGGIATKNRIGHGALAPTLPKNITPATQYQKPPHPLPNRSASSNFMHLNFKKNSLPTPVTTGIRSPMVNDPTLASLNSPTAESPQLLTNAFSGITRQDTVPNVVEDQSMDQEWQPFTQNDTVSPELISPPPLSEAENFLQSIMHPKLAAPLLPTPEKPMEPIPPKAINPTKMPLPIPRRIPKVWRWSGPLFRNSDEQPICNAQIHELTGEQSLKFSMVFEKIDKIQVEYLYNNVEYYSNLDAFRTPPQLGIFGPKAEIDKQPLLEFTKYLTKVKKVFLMPINFDNNIIGHVLFFPYIHRFQVIGMDVPPKYNVEGSLVTAIVPFTLSPEQLVKKVPLTQIPATPSDNTPAKLKQTSGLHPQQILGFPDVLVEYMKENTASRSYCIWSDKSQGKKVDVETQLLASILKSTKAPHVPYASEARMIFVHVGALGTLHNLPRFTERRANLNFVQFYVYGSHPDISPALRSVQEIYPCGGIVTFSPFAMRADPFGVIDLIRKIHAHPLWMAYVLPSALGLLAKLECGAHDPMTLVDKKVLMMDVILEAIAAGKVALIQAPPDKPKVTEEKDAINDWLSKYFNLAPPSKQDALDAGIKDFLSHQSLAKAELSKSKAIMNDEILSDLNRMQKQPSCMAGFRRYVVIDSDLDRPDYHQGVEWTPLGKFDFKDDFYPKQTR